MDNLEFATRCAIGAWFEREQRFAQAIKSEGLPPEALLDEDWLVYWQVQRNSPEMSRDRLRFVLHRAIVELQAAEAGEPSYRRIEELSKEAWEVNLRSDGTSIRPTSLVSKFACSCNSRVFAPKDSYASKTLGRPGPPIPRHGYTPYMRAFIRQKQYVIEQLERRGIAPAQLPYDGNVMVDQETFLMRTTDWYNILETEYSRQDALRYFDIGKFSGPAARSASRPAAALASL